METIKSDLHTQVDRKSNFVFHFLLLLNLSPITQIHAILEERTVFSSNRNFKRRPNLAGF